MIKFSNTKKLILSALFLAIGFVLPIMIGQIPTIGQMLLPMHIPVFLCAMICDWKYGAGVGFVLPIFRSLIFSVPLMYPTAISVAFEMATYGIISGLFYANSKKKSILSIYIALISSMIIGRFVRFFAEFILLYAFGNSFVVQTVVAVIFINSLPGIALQLIIIPAVMLALKRAKLIE